MNLDLKQMTTFNIDTSNPAGNTSSILTNQPIYVGCSEKLNPVNLLNSRQTDIHQEEFPEPYSKLKDQQAKNEFREFCKLVLSIKAYPEAHHRNNQKLLLTSVPLKLSNFLKEIGREFKLSDFLNDHQMTLEEAVLERAELQGANLNEANLVGARLVGARLEGARLEGANLYNANLTNAKLQSANLNDAKLNGAKLVCARLEGARLERANFYEANLEYANLHDANLQRANLNGAFLNHAMFDNQTKFNLGTDLRNINVEDGIYINRQPETDKEKITQFFIDQGAKKQNISFAQAA